MEEFLASPLTPAPAMGWQSTEDKQKAFQERCFLLAVLAAPLALLFPGSCSTPCWMCRGEEWETEDSSSRVCPSTGKDAQRGQLPARLSGLVNQQ